MPYVYDSWLALFLAGSWKGAVVAVKVIVHNTSMARKVDTLRESLVGISMQHPHVVRHLSRLTRCRPQGCRADFISLFYQQSMIIAVL